MYVYNLISKFNIFTENIFYKKLYLGAALILFAISFMLQFFHDKYCDLYSEIIRIIHHFLLFFIYCGAFAPSNYLVVVFIFSMAAFLSWTTQNNTCFLTTIEKNHCHYKKNYRFHDIIYYIDNLKLLPFNIEKINLRYRIVLLSILNIITISRLYVYFTNSNKLEIHGHMGARAIYPENSILAFDYAMSIGVDALELDLNMTKDKQIIIYHDKKINTELCNGISFPIKELTLMQIKEYNCGIVQNKNFKDQQVEIQKIPTFIELLEWINNSNYSNKHTIKLNVEIKTQPDLDSDYEVIEFANKLISILKKYNISDRIIIQSFDERALNAVKSIDSSITLSLLIEDPKINMIELAKKLNVDIISPEYILLNKELVEQMHYNGFKVLPWTINSTKNLQEMIDMNVDCVISDNPEEMIKNKNKYFLSLL